MKKVLFYLGHPAHFHLFKHTFFELKKLEIPFLVLIKTKDVLESLLHEEQIPYINIHKNLRGSGKIEILWSLFIKDFRILLNALRFKPTLLVGTSIEITHVGFLIRKPSLVVNEDDFDVVPQFARLGYPLATKIIAPNSCRLGKWGKKRIGYNGYHELAYLGSSVFKPNDSICSKYHSKPGKPSIFIRISKLNAYHDDSIFGLSSEDLEKIFVLFKDWNIFVSSENENTKVPHKAIVPGHVHDVLANSDVFLGDSQTMTAEAALLGCVAIRYNGFVGKIGYLEELESKYKLAYGFKLSQKEELFDFLGEIKDNVHEYKTRHKKRLENARSNFNDTNEILIDNILKYA